MRIASLVPGATEALFALGLGDQVVGVTHECDWPPEVAAIPPVTASRLDTAELPAAEIDRLVSEAARGGRELYTVDAGRWGELAPDLVVAQEVCDVCAVSAGTARSLEVEVVDYSPTTLDGVSTAIEILGRRLGAEVAGARIGAELRSRLDLIRTAVSGRPRPRVFVAEWLDPPYAAGHWVPDMIQAAGGTEIAGRSGERSVRTSWEAVEDRGPDVVVLAPCGYDLDRTLREAPEDLPGNTVVAVDANAFVSRPGPRLVDGVELLAHLLHPGAWPDPGLPYASLRSTARATQ